MGLIRGIGKGIGFLAKVGVRAAVEGRQGVERTFTEEEAKACGFYHACASRLKAKGFTQSETAAWLIDEWQKWFKKPLTEGGKQFVAYVTTQVYLLHSEWTPEDWQAHGEQAYLDLAARGHDLLS